MTATGAAVDTVVAVAKAVAAAGVVAEIMAVTVTTMGAAMRKGVAGVCGETCYICGSHEHFWRQRPELFCQRCKKKGHGIIYCKGTENAVMAVGLIGDGGVVEEEVIETDDEPTVIKSELEGHAAREFF